MAAILEATGLNAEASVNTVFRLRRPADFKSQGNRRNFVYVAVTEDAPRLVET